MLSSMYHNWAKLDSNEMANLHPDITLIVGHVENAVKFFAHKLVLSNHSGYFKSLLSSYKGYEVHVSNINSHTFAYLLTFMYTGQLDLNPLNVYEIFLASNLLHITEALNLCRQYLADIPQHNGGKSVLKPIPRKKAVLPDAVDNIVHTLKYQPLRINNDQVSSIFKPVGVTAKTEYSDDAISHQSEGETANDDGKTERENGDSKKTQGSTNVILDVACCDGPIKFRKIVNKYYDPNKASSTCDDRTKSEISIACQGCKHVFKNYHKFRKYVTSASVLRNKLTDKRSNLHFKCKKKNETNLQCFTCKTCGSKFPSYYFVQKHRKMHHSETGESIE